MDDGTGTCIVPTANNVRYGTAVDTTTGTCHVPAAASVLNGVAIDATTGTYVAPTTAQVLAGVHFGAASALVGTLAVTVTGSTPVTEGGLLTIVKGDDYTVETVQPIEFTDDGTWPDLTGATVVLYVRQKDNLAYTPELQVTGSLVDDDPAQIIRFEPMKADTTKMVAGELADVYAVRATLPSGQVRTLLVTGLCTVSD